MSAHARLDDQWVPGLHGTTVVGSPSPTLAKLPPHSTGSAPGSDSSVVDHPLCDAHPSRVVGTSPTPALATATPIATAPGSTPPAAVQTRSGPQAGADGGISSTPANRAPAPRPFAPGSTLLEPPVHGGCDTHAPGDGWLELRIWAEMFHDAQQQRIATVNRAERGGVDPDVYAAYTEALESAERVVRLQMIRCYRRTVPAEIQAWVKATRGLDEPLMARLLGHLGHPRWATPHHWEGTGANRVLVADPPFERTVSQLWQYCGHGRPGRAQRGATAEDLAALGSPNLKMLVHLAAEGIVKAGVRKNEGATAFTPTNRHAISDLGQLYLDVRYATWERTHTVACVRCGPAGKPAEPGSPWSAGHQQGDALRKVGKEILRDLWKVAR